MVNHINTIMEIILKENSNSRFILGIDGLSRSGKTTLVRSLEKRLIAEDLLFITIHLDDHITNRKSRYHTGYPEWYEYYYLQWDINWFVNHIFTNLKMVPSLTLPFYKSNDDSHILKTIQIPKICLIIIEGVFLQRKEWRDFLDYTVFLDADRGIRFERESPNTKSAIEKFENRYWKAEEQYLNTENPMNRANLVLTTAN